MSGAQSGKTTKTNTVKAAPHASMLIESMRDIGYSLESALADIIDNSITAGAESIALFADTGHASPRFGILDDGRGMTQAQLLDAMRPGSRSPLDARDSRDLGRFGLGLKTASFSQCRRL
ncbi:MAG: ATP-binding protein, partial [Rhodospirillales bacterium]|nr:ATP-binding protein [Rhodospirillales bacterium]